MKPQSIVIPTEIGAPFLDGFFGGIVCENGDAIAICWPPKAVADIALAQWNSSLSEVEGARSLTDGYANTVAMAAAGSELARCVLAMNTDATLPPYEIPARDVLELGYRHLKPTTDKTYGGYRDGENPSSFPTGYSYSANPPVQTSVALFQAGGAEAFEPAVYWSATQYSANLAWVQYFVDGYQGFGRKGSEFRARLVRRLNLGSFSDFVRSIADRSH